MGCEVMVYDFQLCHVEVSLLSGVNEEGPPEGEPVEVLKWRVVITAEKIFPSKQNAVQIVVKRAKP
jgi:hypothetical protein